MPTWIGIFAALAFALLIGVVLAVAFAVRASKRRSVRGFDVLPPDEDRRP